MITPGKIASIAVFLAAMSSLHPLPAAAGAPPPRVSIQDPRQLIIPYEPYDETANADRDVARAFAQARAEHKRVLIDLGGNWCADCLILSGIMQLPEVERFLNAHFVVVLVDVGRFDRNLQIPAHFGINERLHGVPSVLIANPDGTLVNRGNISALDNSRNMTPQQVVDWLAWWAW